MSITRRELLGRCSMWAAVAAMPASLAAVANAKAKTPPLTESMFTSLMGSTFTIGSGSNQQTLTLVAVDDIPPRTPPTSPTASTFTLRFYGGTKNLKQGTYKFDNATMGSFKMFIVPGSNPQFYNATFNHL